jgi:peptidoglycan/LPS O-acetylase OafA/YrhL
MYPLCSLANNHNMSRILVPDTNTNLEEKLTPPEEPVTMAPPLSRRLSRIITSLFAVVMPSFLREIPKPGPSTPSQKSRIIALQALRGIACLVVFNSHWSYAVSDPYGFVTGDTMYDYIYHWPFLSLLHLGVVWVNVLFVLSGYVLSLSLLKLILARKPIAEVMGAGMTKRTIRIFLPAFATLLLYAVAVQLDLFEISTQLRDINSQSHEFHLELWEALPPRMGSFLDQLIDVIKEAARFIDPSTPSEAEAFARYDPHLWTLPLEFYNSMMIYATICCTWRLSSKARLIVHSCMSLFCLASGQALRGLFLAGIVMAEIDLLSKKQIEQANDLLVGYASSAASRYTKLARSYLPITSCVVGFYLLSMPRAFPEDTAGYAGLVASFPSFMTLDARRDAIRALGAIMAVWSITHVSMTADQYHSPWYHTFPNVFCNAFTLYMGRISFAFYLIHGFVIRSLGYSVLPFVYGYVVPVQDNDVRIEAVVGSGVSVNFGPEESMISTREVCMIWMLGYCIVMPVVICVADLFQRVVITRSITAAEWVDNKLAVRYQNGDDVRKGSMTSR